MMDDGGAMKSSARAFVARAVAYLKVEVAADGNPNAALPLLDQPVLMPMDSGLLVAYVVDEPHGLVYVQHRHLAQAEMGAAELHEIAMANLGKLCAATIEVQKHGPIYGVFGDGNFEASMFLLESLWQRDLAHLVENGFAVIVPTRDILAFCDMDSREGLAVLHQMIERVYPRGDHPLSKKIFRLRKSGQLRESDRPSTKGL